MDWFETFVAPYDHCVACGNTGKLVLDSVTPAGKKLHHEGWCFCPNGRSLEMRRNFDDDEAMKEPQ